MDNKTLEHFFTGKFFVVPNYQRDYSWEKRNIHELWEDIQEAIETNTSHYIGTFILSKKTDEERYKIVDGQQRLTTIIMLINAAIKELPDNNKKIILFDQFIKTDDRWKLLLQTENSEFFVNMLQGLPVVVETKSQKLLKEGYDYILELIKSLRRNKPADLIEWLNKIKSLQVLEFTEQNEGKAIRIFQTVNDRGITLTNIEKVKSLLIYFSNRFLKGELDYKINERFGKAFKYYSLIKAIAEEENYKIPLINALTFTEDSIWRYHFLAYNSEYYDYTANSDYILQHFLKNSLKQYRGSHKKLREFIERYSNDLLNFFSGMLNLVKKVKENPKYYKMFCFMNPSTNLYPLLVRLEIRGLLEKQAFSKPPLSFLDLIIAADIRIYKTRGTDPKRDILFLAKDAEYLSETDIANRLKEYIQYFGDDNQFMNWLSEGDSYYNGALPYIFIDYSESIRESEGTPPYTVEELIRLKSSDPTIEHIFPQNHKFDFPSKGFRDKEEYLKTLNKIGNLTLLEKSINSRCRDESIESKTRGDRLYKNSLFEITRQFAADVETIHKVYTKENVINRTKVLAIFCIKRFLYNGSS